MRIGLVVKTDSRAQKKAVEVERWLKNKKIEVVKKESLLPERNLSDKNTEPAPNNLFCIFVLGGDGTLLSAVRWIRDQNIPILGVKFGEMGFLAEAVEEHFYDIAQSILDGRFTTMPRMRLQVNVVRNKKKIADETVLNDVVMNKGALARLAHIETFIDDHYLTTFRADGLVVSTPTGSTAYSLAAGGPIIHPEVPGMILTPICPFTLTMRPLIVPDTISITMKLPTKSSDMMLTFDGQAGLKINGQDEITIKKADHPIHMINVPDQHYYDVLKTKLHWSGEYK